MGYILPTFLILGGLLDKDPLDRDPLWTETPLGGTWDQGHRPPEGTWDEAPRQEVISYRDPLSGQNDRHMQNKNVFQ